MLATCIEFAGTANPGLEFVANSRVLSPATSSDTGTGTLKPWRSQVVTYVEGIV